MIQWLWFAAFTAVGPGSVPVWGTKIPQAVRYRQKKKKKAKYVFFSITLPFVLKRMCEHFRATTFVLRRIFFHRVYFYWRMVALQCCVSFLCLGDCFDILSGPAEMPSVAEMPRVHFRQIEKGIGPQAWPWSYLRSSLELTQSLEDKFRFISRFCLEILQHSADSILYKR